MNPDNIVLPMALLCSSIVAMVCSGLVLAARPSLGKFWRAVNEGSMVVGIGLFFFVSHLVSV